MSETRITPFPSSPQCTAGSSGDSPNTANLLTNLEGATKLLHITPALLQSSDGRCSRQGRYNEYADGNLVDLIDWLVVFAERSRHKYQRILPKLVDSEQVSLCMSEEVSPRLLAPNVSRCRTPRNQHGGNLTQEASE